MATIKNRIGELQKRDEEADKALSIVSALLSGTLPAMKRWPAA
jgi:hypothetical protein